MKKENTASRLKKIMSDNNFRQIDILNLTAPYCQKYGVKMNKSDISQYCSGKSEPNQDKLFVLGMALNVNEAWLMGYDVPMERSTPESFKRWAEQYNKTHKQFTLDSGEETLVSQYRKLNMIGKKKLIITAKEMNCSPLYNDNYQVELAAAHKRTDAEEAKADIISDLDMMLDENF